MEVILSISDQSVSTCNKATLIDLIWLGLLSFRSLFSFLWAGSITVGAWGASRRAGIMMDMDMDII